MAPTPAEAARLRAKYEGAVPVLCSKHTHAGEVAQSPKSKYLIPSASAAHELQDKIVLTQADPGSYTPSHAWDMEEMLAVRASYQKILKEKGYKSEDLLCNVISS